jgi:hypothetical protein
MPIADHGTDLRASRFDECMFRILLKFPGNVARDAMFNPRSTEEDIMKKLGYVIAALGAIAVAMPSIASAEAVVIKHRDHDRYGARAEMHRDHGWREHHDRKVVIIKHRHHDY